MHHGLNSESHISVVFKLYVRDWPILSGCVLKLYGAVRKSRQTFSHTGKITAFNSFYRAMHFSAKRGIAIGIAIACRLSVCPSVRLSVCL